MTKPINTTSKDPVASTSATSGQAAQPQATPSSSPTATATSSIAQNAITGSSVSTTPLTPLPTTMKEKGFFHEHYVSPDRRERAHTLKSTTRPNLLDNGSKAHTIRNSSRAQDLMQSGSEATVTNGSETSPTSSDQTSRKLKHASQFDRLWKTYDVLPELPGNSELQQRHPKKLYRAASVENLTPRNSQRDEAVEKLETQKKTTVVFAHHILMGLAVETHVAEEDDNVAFHVAVGVTLQKKQRRR